VRDFAGNMSTRRVALSQGQLTVRGDQSAVTVSGPIRAGTSAIQNARWTERINPQRGVSSSEYQISGDFDADDLERLGYPVARYAQGRIGVTVTGEGRGFDVDNARIDLNLRNAAVELPRSMWTKRAGVAASAQFVVQRQSDGGLAFNQIDARGGGMFMQGRVQLGRDNSVQEVELPRLVIEGPPTRGSPRRAPRLGRSTSTSAARCSTPPRSWDRSAPRRIRQRRHRRRKTWRRPIPGRCARASWWIVSRCAAARR
jgi:hypothetical protein